MCFPLWTFVSSVVDAFVPSTGNPTRKKPIENAPRTGTSATVVCILQFVKGVRVSLAFRYPKT
jgi:hypothetical protein